MLIIVQVFLHSCAPSTNKVYAKRHLQIQGNLTFLSRKHVMAAVIESCAEDDSSTNTGTSCWQPNWIRWVRCLVAFPVSRLRKPRNSSKSRLNTACHKQSTWTNQHHCTISATTAMSKSKDTMKSPITYKRPVVLQVSTLHNFPTKRSIIAATLPFQPDASYPRHVSNVIKYAKFLLKSLLVRRRQVPQRENSLASTRICKNWAPISSYVFLDREKIRKPKVWGVGREIQSIATPILSSTLIFSPFLSSAPKSWMLVLNSCRDEWSEARVLSPKYSLNQFYKDRTDFMPPGRETAQMDLVLRRTSKRRNPTRYLELLTPGDPTPDIRLHSPGLPHRTKFLAKHEDMALRRPYPLDRKCGPIRPPRDLPRTAFRTWKPQRLGV